MEEGKNNVAGSSLDRRLGHRCSVLEQRGAAAAALTSLSLHWVQHLRGVDEQ
jgi:hypothetical protein